MGWFFFAPPPVFAEALLAEANSNLLSIAELQKSFHGESWTVQSFRLEGVVCAVVPQRQQVVLQDASGAVLMELPSIDPALTAGDVVTVVGQHCSLNRDRYGIRVGTAPVVDDDGTHAVLERSGKVFLDAGSQPIRAEWFNGKGEIAFRVEYAGPALPRQMIPAGKLWHSSATGTNQAKRLPGLHYLAYEGNDWFGLPDFSQLQPVASGVATNFSVDYRTRPEQCALTFDGLIQIPQPGLYTFYLASDDGGRLFVGDAAAQCQLTLLGRKATPQIINLEPAAPKVSAGQWTALEGNIIFAGQNDIGTELEIVAGAQIVQATVIGGSSALGVQLMHQAVRVAGVGEISSSMEQRLTMRLVIPGVNQIQILPPAAEAGASVFWETTLTTVWQIQRLEPAQAMKKIPVRITGTIIQVSPLTLVLEDATGGVFVHYSAGDWAGQPQIGDVWQLEGTTDPGDFSPVVLASSGKFLGVTTLPEPIRPTWDQLINGSLDAQYVEIHGVVVAVNGEEMVLLTPDGKIKVEVDEMRRFYRGGQDAFINLYGNMQPDDVAKSYLGSVVRIRGCVAAVRNQDTRQIRAGEIRLTAAVVSVEQPRPADPFASPVRIAADLLLFDPRASTLQRTKVTGQIIYARPNEYLIQNGSAGFRARTEAGPELAVGDVVEAEGFPQLGGPSPVLLAAQLRSNGARPLPPPKRIFGAELLDRQRDATRVEIEATLLSVTIQQRERSLELQAGPTHFLARLYSPHGGWSELLPGSRLRLTGVYSSAQVDHGDSDPFELLLNRPDSIVVLQQPSWWTIEHAIAVISLLAAGLSLALIWVTLLHRKVEARTTQLKQEIEGRQLAEQRRAVEKERARVAQDLHDELGAGLTEVSILGSLANTDAVPAATKAGYLEQLTHVARTLVASLDEIVWAVNPHYDSAPSLASYYSLFAQRFLNLAGIACRLQIANDIPEYPLDAKVRHGVFCAFKEALNNVIRHSGATEVQLAIKVVENQLIISVVDNGRGFESIDAAPGKDGLTGLGKRLHELGGDCQITSQSGQGTKVEFSLPLNPI